MKPQPLIAVADVGGTRQGYQEVLGFDSGHGRGKCARKDLDGSIPVARAAGWCAPPLRV